MKRRKLKRAGGEKKDKRGREKGKKGATGTSED